MTIIMQKNFLLELGNPYREVLIDRDGVKSIELGAIGVPETYLVNKEKNYQEVHWTFKSK